MKLASIAAGLLFPALLHAAEPPPKISACFYAFGYVPGQEKVNIQTSAANYEEIQLSKANIVGPVSSVVTEGSLQIHSKSTTPEGKTIYPVLSTAKVPTGIAHALVILFPNPKNPQEPYRSLVFNYDTSDFPLGVYRLINLSPNPIRGSVARNYVEAKPGGIADLKPEGEPEAIVPVRFEFFKTDRWNLLTETRCAIRNDRRWLTCVYEDPATGRMNIRSIPDRSVKEPAAAAGN